MPRRPRLQAPGLPVHIIQRGNNRQACFFADEDAQFFLEQRGKELTLKQYPEGHRFDLYNDIQPLTRCIRCNGKLTEVDKDIVIDRLEPKTKRYYNQFHIQGAKRLPRDEIIESVGQLMQEPANTVFITMSNDESAATEAWKMLKAESLPNVYILEGGVNNWIRTYGEEEFVEEHLVRQRENDEPAYRFNVAIGSRHPAAEPNPYAFEIEFEPKVKLELKRAPTSGGCG